MTHRTTLANRRPAVTYDLEFWGQRVTVTIDPDNGLEAFLSTHRSGSGTEAAVRDSAILFSLARQYGCPLETIARAVTRNNDGTPSTPIGAVVDQLIAAAEDKAEAE